MMYRQADIVWVNFPFSDQSTSKIRPALVISNTEQNKSKEYILLQITSRSKSDVFNCELAFEDYQQAPLEITSYVRCNRVFTLNEQHILGRKTRLKNRAFQKILKLFFEVFS